jgi:molecular chaperone DnaK
MAKRCGIDLGTTFTSISYFDQDYDRVDTIDLVESADGQKILRSVVYFPGPGESPVVGTAAWNAYRLYPDQVVVGIKRSMGSDFTLEMHSQQLTPQQISAEILKTVVKDAITYLGEAVEEVVITVPAYFGDAERAATEEAGKLAGLSVLGLLPEPHAAALAYSIEKVTDILDRDLLVYDLGGGTFDVTLIHATTEKASDGSISLKIDTLCKDGNARLGGLDWDRALSEVVRQKVLDQFGVDINLDPRNEPILMDNCEKAKRDLGRTSQVSIIADMENHQVTVSVAEFEDATSDLLMMTQVLLEQVLADAEAQHNLPKAKIDVMLTGGASKMPMVKRMVSKVLGKDPFTHRNPELLVTIGAAYWAHLLQPGTIIIVPDGSGGKTNMSVPTSGLTDTSTYGIGVEVLRPDGKGGYQKYNAIIAPAGSVYGKEFTRDFRTAEDNMTAIDLVLYKGDSEDISECKELARVMITGLPSGRPKGSFVHVTVSYDNSGILQGRAVDVETGKDASFVVDRTKIST